MAGPFHIVLFMPNDPRPYFWWRDSERRMSDGGLCPEFSLSVQDAKFKILHRAEDAVAERDRFRKYWPSYRIVIRRTDGSTEDQYEDRTATVSQTDSSDNRNPLWVIPDDLDDGTSRGFLVQPAYTAKLGKCWAVRSSDVPSMNEEVPSSRETVYDADPAMAVRRARELWGDAMKPFAHPLIEARAEAQIKQLMNSVNNPPRPGLRPGSHR
jgi:hypothetical protein